MKDPVREGFDPVARTVVDAIVGMLRTFEVFDAVRTEFCDAFLTIAEMSEPLLETPANDELLGATDPFSLNIAGVNELATILVAVVSYSQMGTTHVHDLLFSGC